MIHPVRTKPIVTGVAIALLASFGAVARAGDTVGFDDAAYARVLADRVDSEGFVDYAALQADRADLDEYIRAIGSVSPAIYDAWSEPQRLAFLINAYNAFTLRAIIDNYPIKSGFFASLRFPRNSIRQISGVWDDLEWELAGSTVTLGQIEHEMIRKGFDEPRIHMAINCASVGCPPLRNEPYRAGRLDEQLADQTRRFLADRGRFRIDRGRRRVYISSIFDWFGEDFVAGYRPRSGFRGNEERKSVLSFIAAQLDKADAEYLRAGDYRVVVLDYDWSLNDAAGARGE